MNLQQLQYIVAVDKYRHFVKAAESCGITQSTLSSMIRNLENELDVTIFDRNAHPVRPTATGEKIIAQARNVLFNARQLEEIPSMEKSAVSGNIHLGIIPTIAPYILPKFFKEIRQIPGISAQASERQTSALVERLKRAELDMAIMATPLNISELLEIPLYYEKFFAYVSPEDPLYDSDGIDVKRLPGMDLWLLQEGHCFRNQAINLCSSGTSHSAMYEAGSIDTLVKVVDMNGGHTIIPELHLQFLDAGQRKNVRNIIPSDSVREVSLVIRNDYVKEGLLNTVSDVIRKIIPENMIDSRLKKFAIRI